MTMPYSELLKLVLPETVVTLTALGVLAVGLTKRGASGLCLVLAAAGLLVSVATLFGLPQHAILFHGMLVITPLTSLFKAICLLLAFFTVLLARGDRSLPNQGEYLAMILLATIGLMLLVGSEELLMIFIGLELTGLSLYVLTGFDKSNLGSAEAGLKYFLFGSTASAFTLFGISLIYGLSGATGLAEIARQLGAGPVPPLLAAGIVMALIGFAFKIAAAPFHLWAPDTYQGAPVPSAAFIASASKVASFVVLGKIVLTGLGPVHGSADWHSFVAGWTPLLAILAALSILIGNFVALAQKNVRRLLAYSAVAHGGYTLVGLVAGGREGFSATLFYTTTYAITLVGAFGVVGIVRRETGGDDLKNFSGLCLSDRFGPGGPLLAGCMAVFLLSLAGLPPLAGFFGKFYLFSAAFHPGASHGLLWLVALALFGSLVSLFYYLTVLKVIFLEPASGATTGRSAIHVDFIQGLSMLVLAAAVLFFGLAPEPLVSRILASLP